MAENRNLALVEDETNILLLRYLDLEFVDDVADYKCGRCDRVVIKHYISNCGHHFCLNCKKILEDGGPTNKWRCPVCQQFIDHVDHQNVKLAEQINALRVKCPNSKYGCPFVSSIDSMPGHMKECKKTKDAALPAIYKGTHIMQAVLDEIGKMNKKIDALNEGMNFIGEMRKKIDMLSEGINVMSDMIIQLDKVDNENRKHVDDLKHKVNEVQSELQAKTDKMQNDIKTIQDNNDGGTSQVADEMKSLQIDLDNTKAEVNGKTKFIIEMWDQKEEKLNQKLSQAKIEMDNAMDTERAVQLNKHTALVNATQKSFNRMAGQMKTLETTQKTIESQLRAEVNEIKAELIANKPKQEIQMVAINKCNELTTNLKLTQDEIKIKIQEIEHKITELNQNRKLMEDEFTIKERNDLNKIREVVSYHTQLETQSLAHSWTIKDIQQKIKKNPFECESQVFSLHGYHFAAKVKFQINAIGRVYMSLCFVDNANRRYPIAFNILPTVTYVLKDQKANKNGIKYTWDMNYQNNFEYDTYYYHGWTYCKDIMNPPYVQDDSIVIDIYVEPPSIAYQMHSTDGVMTFHINNYQMNKALTKDLSFYSQSSPYFYTGPNGYRVQLWMYLDGYHGVEEKGLIALIHFLPGEFDAALSKSFKFRATITIFNQKDPTQHLVQSVEQVKEERQNNLVVIAPSYKIESGGYLVNDTLILRAKIELT